MTEAKIYSLCEAVADIAYLAGTMGYYSGDSRADISEFIRLAKKFEEEYAPQCESGWIDLDYITEIELFCELNFNMEFLHT